MSLFRKEALDHQRDKYLGEVLLFRSTKESLLVSAIVVTFVTGLCFVANAQHNRRQSVDGYLTLSSGVVNVRSAKPGIVKKINVKHGDDVKEGEVLFLIENDESLSHGSSATDMVVQTYQNRLDEIEQQKTLLEQQQAVLDGETRLAVESSERNLSVLEKNVAILRKNLANSSEKYQMGQELLKNNVVSKVQVIEFKNEVMLKEYELNSTLGKVSEIKDQLELTLNQNSLHKFNVAEKLRQVLEKQNQLTERIIELKSNKQFSIKATTAGRISFVNVQVGEPVSDDILAAILPADSEVEANLLVPAAAIGFIEKNQQVLIRYSSFPYQKYGLQSGSVSSINQSILLPHELRKSPVPMTEAAYVVRVRLDSQSVTAHGQQFSIRPGMTLSADIQLETRTVLEWLLEPLFSLRGRL